MLSTREDLLEKLWLGEDSFFELKEIRTAGSKIKGPTQDALADEMAAFANSLGGVLLLGVSDDRDVVGIPAECLAAAEELVQKACLQSIRPALAPIIEKITLPDFECHERPVIRIEVKPSCFVHESPGGYFRRVGSSKTRMPPDQLAWLFQQRSQSRMIRFEETPVMEAPMEVLEEALWRRFAPDNAADSIEVLLHKLALVRKGHDGKLHPTVSGLLMASRVSHVYLKGSFIQAVAYRETGMTPIGEMEFSPLDAEDIKGPLDEQILGACDFVQRNGIWPFVKPEDGGREDCLRFDMFAVFEAIVNAVAHRDYSMSGSKVRLRLFEDRLEIYSPGTLINTMTTDSLPYRQAARNEILTSLLSRCAVPQARRDYMKRGCMMNKRGEGVTVILNCSQALSGKRPTYRMLNDSELILTIYGRNYQRRGLAFSQENVELMKAERRDFWSDMMKKLLIIG